ncbi:DUF1598 domain-containing protein [Stieleria varia]|uniref:DUF1598 domain-containing protein n=1 Tax=Stieleria varia TaxID=2528005 RepID=A0A5C6A3F1_9BACT|nr:DUF1598 domain-containing protein [Stieleria varia]TWT93867.1 hypothetical protein Pla52n_56950 [Stieleria varia]
MELGIARLTRSVVALTFAGFLVAASLDAGFNGGGGGRNVGGVMIDTAGVVRTATVEEQQEFVNLMRAGVAGARGDLDKATDLRMVSLSGLQNAITDVRQKGGRLPESIQYLAGLTRVEYVFVDEKTNDLVIAGPAEPWTVAADGSIVGTKTGAAILHLEDLVVAIRSVETARHGGISCSIEPTAEGRQRLHQLIARIKQRPVQNPAVFEESMKQAYGPQTIELHGIPADSRYACTMVAADYEMKRLAMGLVDAPVKGMPSYIAMSRNAAHSAGQNPRWWMECNYESLSRNAAGTAWKLSGQGIKTLTEQDVIAADGTATGSGRKDKLATQWAEKMTEKYTELARELPIFGDMRNLMDLTVVATLIVQENLESKAGMELSVLRDGKALEPIAYDPPRTIAPECSFVKGRAGWVVTASGGVSVNAFEIVAGSVENEAAVAETHSIAMAKKTGDQKTGEQWWWNR